MHRAHDVAALSRGAQCLFRIGAKTPATGFVLVASSEARRAVANVVACDDEIARDLVFAAEHDMRMRVVRVPVVDRNPVKPGSEVCLHVLHEVTREAVEILELHRVFRGNNEAERVPIVAPTGFELLQVGGIGPRAVGLRRLTVAGDAISGDKRGWIETAPEPAGLSTTSLTFDHHTP